MRKADELRRGKTVLSVFVVWTLVFSGTIGLGASLVALGADEPIQPTDWVISSYWNMTGDLVLDTNLIIQGPAGNLTVWDGGIVMDQDVNHPWSITIGAGGSLALYNSYITVEPDKLSPYYLLTVDVAGTLYGENAVLQFPGHVNVTGSLILWDSDVTGLLSIDTASSSQEEDRYNDAPTFYFSNGQGQFYRTSIEHMFTLSLGYFDRNDPTYGFIYDFNVTGNSEVWFVDSHLSIDYNSGVRNHNVLWARDSAQVYAYNLTIDTGQVGPGRVPAIQTDLAPSTATVHLLRWADVLCVDSSGVPIQGVTLAQTLVQTGAARNYPDSGGANPPNHILNYLGQTALTWKTTGPDGKALLPLPSEHIDYNVDQTQPNSEFYGPYRITGTYGPNITSAVFSFSPYPAMDPVDGTYYVTLQFPDILPKPDLIVSDIVWSPDPATEPEAIFFNATIVNQGGGGANEIYVWFFVDGQQLNDTPTKIEFLNGFGDSEVTPGASGMVKWNNSIGGNHSIRVVVDMENRIAEDPDSGGEGNNDRWEQFYVIPLLPDYVLTSGGITFPPAVFIGNPVRIDIVVSNDGNLIAPPDSVRVYIGDPVLGQIGGGDAPLGYINVTGTNNTFVYHTFDKAGDYKVCAWVDYDNDVVEKFEDNNQACANVTVGHAPNLAVTVNDIGIGDPCTRTGEAVRPQATVRNLGYIDAPAYQVDFLIDDMLVGSGNSAGLPANQSEVVLSSVLWTPSDPGIYILKVRVDPNGVVQESSVADNDASRDILIFNDKMAGTYAGPSEAIDSDFEFDGNIDITGSLTITDAHVSFFQPEITKGRYCIEVSGTGSLTLQGSTLTSNYPLVIYLTDNAQFTVMDSIIELDKDGTGGLYADSAAQIVIESSSLWASTFATGQSVSMKGVDLLGSELFIETISTSYIWDSSFIEITDLYLLTDDGNINTVDFDIRNVTDFLDDPNLFNQFVFGGSQLVELTSVPLPDEWWLTVVTENAKVRIFWWLTVEMVDGTGSILPTSAISNLTFETLNVVTLGWDLEVGSPHNFAGGLFVYRALSLEMQAYPMGGWVNSTYAITADVTVDMMIYWPDTQESRGNWTGKIHSDTTVELQFSGLTPDFSVAAIDFIGPIVVGNDQPVNIELAINASIYNSGNIASDDVEVFMYRGPQLIGWDSISVPAAGYGFAVDYWTPTSIGPISILVCVDVNNTKDELNEDNNCLTTQLNVFGWPNLDIDVADVHVIKPVENVVNTVIVTVRNVGTDTAYNVDVRLDDDEGGSDIISLPIIAVGGAVDAYLNYTPVTSGNHYINITVFSSNVTIYETDYDWSNNFVSVIRNVLARPDLQVGVMEVNGGLDVTVGSPFTVQVEVINTGGSDAANFTVQLILDNTTYPGQLLDVSVSAGQGKNVIISSQAVYTQGVYWMCAFVDHPDPFDIITESNESNNVGCIAFNVVPPFGSISLSSPAVNAVYNGGDGIYVSGWVQEDGTNEGIPNVAIRLRLETTDGVQVGAESYVVSVGSGSNIGMIATTFYMPTEVECGFDYILRATTNESNIRQFTVQIGTPACPEEMPFWVWLLIIIIIIVVIVVIAITAYIRYFGLGKLVECGECGAFIPEDSHSCPKCGVEFETETAKCSSCQAWIPLKVKKCPECGVEFATGEIEMEDYKAKMQMQYDEVRTKFKAEAELQLGKTLTDAEFESWWKAQPTFMTFDQWLKQEEDMRKMGSKPCPSCGTLNSVTATVCHKCGTVMVEEEEPRRPPAKPPEEKPEEAVPAKKGVPETAPPRREGMPPVAAPPAAVKPVPKKTLPTVERPVPKKVIRKPIMEGRPAVVPKKVTKKPGEEEEET